MHLVKLVTFDATNTLLKFSLPPWEYYALVAQKYGFKGTPNDIKLPLKNSMKFMSNTHPNFGRSSIFWKEWWRRVIKLTFQHKLPEQANIDVMASELIDVFCTQKCWDVTSGANDILKCLHDRGKYVGIISNFDPRLHDVLYNLQLFDKIDFVLTSYDVGICKPDKRIFDIARQKYYEEIEPIECLHIGDDFKNDYEGARGAGWNSLLIGEEVHKAQITQDHVFSNLVDLSLVIENNMLKL